MVAVLKPHPKKNASDNARHGSVVMHTGAPPPLIPARNETDAPVVNVYSSLDLMV